MEAPMLQMSLLALLLGATVQAREAPAPHCVDARQIQEAHQADPQTLALRTADGVRARLTLASACPDVIDDASLQLLGRAGWVCGTPGDAVRSATRTCGVASVAPVDARTYAALVRQARDQPDTLDAVVVRGRRVQGFGGTPDYCVATSGLRSWHEDPDGLVVEVSPRRAAGNRYYRIETAGGCGDQINAATLSLVSGMGLGMVCGHAGDRVVFSRGQPASESFDRPRMQSALARRAGCHISRVYPLER